jgi:hypothetical protein
VNVRKEVDSFNIYEIMNRNDFIVRRQSSVLLLQLYNVMPTHMLAISAGTLK